jgi:hypothetical protein
MASVQEILSETRSFVEEKRAAAFDEKQGLAGQDPNTYPGAENDKPVDDSMKQPTPGAEEDVNSPSGAYSAEGATPANQKEQGTALEATDAPPASVKKEPEQTADAMAGPKGQKKVGDQPVSKHAELATSLLNSIKAAQEGAGDDPETGEGDNDPDKQAGDDPETGEGDNDPDKQAGDGTPGEITLTQDVLAKIAETLLATEEGWNTVEQGLSKAAGAEAARKTMSYLADQEQELQKQAAHEQGYQDAEALIQQAIYQRGVEDTKAAMDKTAKGGYAKKGKKKSKKKKDTQEDDDQKQAAVKGYQDAGQLIEALQKQADTQNQQPANENEAILQRLGAALADNSVKSAQADLAALAGGMPGEGAGLGAAPGMDAAMGMPGAGGGMPGPEEAMDEMGGVPEDEEITPEELQEALAMMVQEGQISEEEAAAIMDYIQSGEEVAGAGEEDMADAGLDEGAGEDTYDEEAGMEAAASADSLLAAIQRVKNNASDE